jgi:hypothetical protein
VENRHAGIRVQICACGPLPGHIQLPAFHCSPMPSHTVCPNKPINNTVYYNMQLNILRFPATHLLCSQVRFCTPLQANASRLIHAAQYLQPHAYKPMASGLYLQPNGFRPLPAAQWLQAVTCSPRASGRYLQPNGFRPLPAAQRLQAATCSPMASGRWLQGSVGASKAAVGIPR